MPRQLIGASLFHFVGTHTIEAAHQQIAQDNGLRRAEQQRQREAEAFVRFQPPGIDRNDRNMPQTGLFQRTADKADVVARTAAAARLRHGQRQPIRVIFAGQHLLHHLTHRDDGRIARIVVDKFQTGINGAARVVFQHNHMVAVLFHHRLKQAEVDGRHVRCQNGISLLLHLACIFHAVILRRNRMRHDAALFALCHRRQQRPYTNARRSQRIDFINLNQRIQLTAALHNLRHLIGRHRVQAAAKGVELNQFQIIMLADKLRCQIQPGMIHPLIHHAQRMIPVEGGRNAVLRQHGQTVGRNQLRHAVVDFRIHMVRATGQHNALAMIFLHPGQRLLPLGTHIRLGAELFFPCGMDGLAHLFFRNAVRLAEEAHQRIRRHLFVRQRQEGLEHAHAPFGHIFHIVGNVFGIGHHHRAVEMVLRLHILLPLVKHARIEDRADPFINQPLHMAMRHFRRIAFTLRRDGFHALFIHCPAGSRRQDDAEFQCRQQRHPEGEVFIHVQHPGNAQHATGGLFFAQRLIVKQAVQLVGHDVRGFFALCGLSQSLFAAVAGDVPSAAGEKADREHAMIGAALTASRARLPLQRQNLFQRQRGRRLFHVLRMLPGNQRRAESAHHAGNIRADGLHPGQLLKGTQHRPVMERAALHHNVRPQLFGIGQLNHLEQRVFDHRAGQSGADVLNGRALLLRLLDVGVHKHGAARSQIHRLPGKQRFRCKALRRIAHGIREVFQETAAAGGTGFVEQNRVHRAAFQLDALHVLSADVQHAIHLRVKEGRCGTVCNRFHLAVVQAEGGFEQTFAITSGTGACNPRRFRHFFHQLAHGRARCVNRAAGIAGVEAVEQLALFANQRHLRRG